MCILLKTGLVDYKKAYALQRRILSEKLSGNAPDALIISEHKPVITLGRGFEKQNLLAETSDLQKRGIDVFEVERGGDATYHGPGQLVGYPIFNLASRNRDVRFFMFCLEEAIIITLRSFCLEADRREESTGVWIGEKKIASIGIAVRRWITYHGFALNIFPDLKNFSFINPCGLHYNIMTSMERELGSPLKLADVEKILVKNFERVFEIVFTTPGWEAGNA